MNAKNVVVDLDAKLKAALSLISEGNIKN